jgi:PAS domain S-box-containing protein
LGEAPIVSIVVLPILFEGKTKAVIELATMHRFTEVNLAFLDQLAVSIGVVFNTIEATMRTEGLLEESQRLTVELRELNNTLEQRVAERTASLNSSTLRLRDSERQLQELIAAIPAAIYTTDAEGRITYFNQAAVELSGRTPTIGSDEWCVSWQLYQPDGTSLPYRQSPMALALKEGRDIRNAEAVAERPDGTRVPFIPYPTPLRDGVGNIVGAINMLVDVSERKQAETQQRVLLNELNHRVKNNMQMLQTLLQTETRQAGSTEARAALEEASGRVAAMAAAQQVLYATSDAARFNARDFLKTICEAAKRAFPQELHIDCEADSAQLPNDAAMPLALIANELLTNAVKHGISTQNRPIRVRLTQENDKFLFYVEDEGPGFDLRSVQRRSSGLALVQGLARQLRGKFEVTRTPATRCSVWFQQS